MPSLIEKQQKQIAMLQHEIPTLQEITARKWSKAEELERLKQGCKELQQRIDEALKEAESPKFPKKKILSGLPDRDSLI
jgi:uncharacterized protein (UPF0335 family)